MSEDGEGTDKPLLLIDKRELRATDRITAVKRKRVYDWQEDTLPVGDYVFKDTEYAFEVKTSVDLLGSIRGRLWQQLDELAENYAYPFLVVETGNLDYQLSKNPAWRRNGQLREKMKATLYSALASIMEKGKVRVITIDHMDELADWLVVFAKRITKEKRKPSGPKMLITHKKKDLSGDDAALYLLTAFGGIGPSVAEALLLEYGSVAGVINAGEDILKVKGVGPATWDVIKRTLHHAYKPTGASNP